MAVKFISHVDQNGIGEWFIKLTDTLEESSVICNNIEEYEKQIEEQGAEYGGEIEVVWTRSNLPASRPKQVLPEGLPHVSARTRSSGTHFLCEQ